MKSLTAASVFVALSLLGASVAAEEVLTGADHVLIEHLRNYTMQAYPHADSKQVTSEWSAMIRTMREPAPSNDIPAGRYFDPSPMRRSTHVDYSQAPRFMQDVERAALEIARQEVGGKELAFEAETRQSNTLSARAKQLIQTRFEVMRLAHTEGMNHPIVQAFTRQARVFAKIVENNTLYAKYVARQRLLSAIQHLRSQMPKGSSMPFLFEEIELRNGLRNLEATIESSRAEITSAQRQVAQKVPETSHTLLRYRAQFQDTTARVEVNEIPRNGREPMARFSVRAGESTPWSARATAIHDVPVTDRRGSNPFSLSGSTR